MLVQAFQMCAGLLVKHLLYSEHIERRLPTMFSSAPLPAAPPRATFATTCEVVRDTPSYSSVAKMVSKASNSNRR